MAVAADEMHDLRYTPGAGAARQMADVVRQLEAPLRAFLRQKTRSRDDAEDLAQEIFLRLWRMEHGIEIRSLKAFAFKMANNLLKDRGRRTHTRMMRKAISTGDLQLSDMGEGEPSKMVECLQTLATLSETIARLRPSTRTAFLLHRFESCSHAQIGARMGISVSMVEKHIIHAAAALRAAGVHHPER